MAVAEEVAEKLDLESCDICGQHLPSASLVFSDSKKEFLCEECLAELESCGCADDIS
ncbi:MAG: hypothetical protein ABFQ82_02610 [Thermodesulfobacteriota bacterium]